MKAAIHLGQEKVKVMLCDVSDFRLRIADKLGFSVCNTEKFPMQSRRLQTQIRLLL